MSVRTEIRLWSSFSFEPQRLVEVNKSVPTDYQFFVPLDVHGPPFYKDFPRYTLLGSGAVLMSLGGPFGVKQGDGEWRVLSQSQKTSGIELSRDHDRAAKWLAVFDTEDPLTPLDEGLFSDFLRRFAECVETRLAAKDKQTTRGSV